MKGASGWMRVAFWDVSDGRCRPGSVELPSNPNGAYRISLENPSITFEALTEPRMCTPHVHPMCAPHVYLATLSLRPLASRHSQLC